MDNEHVRPERDDEALGETTGEELLDRLISDEMGEKIAQVMRAARHAQEAWHRARHPDEGLRERKRRLTRQLISDAATAMFATRGFDNVKVAEVADRVGVSEKTVYNYFPTKESLVLDTADEAVERMARALRERGPGESPTTAVVQAIKDDTARFDEAPEDLVQFIPLFLAMVHSTPALRAAWLEVQDRLATVAAEELAAQAGVDPRDPEPMAAGRALAGLAEVAMDSRIRRIREGLRGEELHRTVDDDLERAARLLETGLWSFNLPRSQRAKQQALEAARAAEDARTQVLKALRQARAAWAEVRRGDRP
jgi:AcrR family transcriptional regulator